MDERCEAKENASEQGHGEGEKQNHPIDSNLFGARNAAGIRNRDQFQAAEGEANTEHPASKRQ